MYFNPDYASLLSSVWITNFGRLEPRRERRESAFESQTRESEIRDRDCELEKVDNLMEDIQFSSAVEGSLAPAMNEAAHNSVAAESIETGLDMPSKVQDGLAPMSHGPKMTVQVVIEQKSVAKVEEPILPDHYYDNGNVPVFKPTMDQFRDFEHFITRINEYGMRAGIVKVIPPPEWREALPPLDEKVKEIRLKSPIEQQFAGGGGIFRQTNLEKRRVYNLPQWREVCESTDHQPPARRGEVRMAGHTVNKRKAKPKKASPKKTKRGESACGSAAATSRTATETPAPGAPEVVNATLEKACVNCWTTDAPAWRKDTNGAHVCNACGLYMSKRGVPRPVVRPETKPAILDLPPQTQGVQIPSPEHSSAEDHPPVENLDTISPELDVAEPDVDQPSLEPINRPATPHSPPDLKRKRTASIVLAESESEPDDADEDSDFQNFNYRISNSEEYTVGRCKDLERIYWKTVTFNNPMYGADLPGSLFDDRTDVWNVAKLDNLLCRIGKTIPGVNSAYLYLGMWKATFSWHVEDMDLYSINYIHFGAPKQWYSINQCDAEKFEAVMRSHFQNDHKGCPQFMRHKTFLASPSALESKGIKVNRLVHHEGEFVITFPFGYHSGYNLGYNCAESVNFATEDWLDIGRKARKCNCAEDSVNINVDDIIDAIRGGPPDEGAPLTPPDSLGAVEEVKKKKRDRKKVESAEKPQTPKKEKRKDGPCMLCPNDSSRESLLPTETGKQAHRICAEFVPETWIATTEDGHEIVAGTEQIPRPRWDLKCLYCSSTRGAKFQCSVKQCFRAYHATCGLAAGVLVETASDEQGFVSSYQCRFHRPKRPALPYLEDNQDIAEFAKTLQPGDAVQARFTQLDSDVPFVGWVAENCESEKMVVLELPNGELFEVAYKWILAMPKRDVRALCANQSAGSTKKRQKKKPKVEPVDGIISLDSQPHQPPDTTQTAKPLTPYLPVPLPQQSNPTSTLMDWTARNPGLAQYHQYVLQSQQHGKGANSSDDPSAVIMQRLQATSAQSTLPTQNGQTSSVKPPEVVLPPPQFNMGQPPPTLMQSARSFSHVQQPSYTILPQQPYPLPSQQSLAPPSQAPSQHRVPTLQDSPAPPPQSRSIPSFIIMPNVQHDQETVEYQNWPPRYVHHSMQPRPQPQSQQRPLMPAYPRPIAPSPLAQESHPPLPQYHPQQMPANFWELLNRQNQNQH